MRQVTTTFPVYKFNDAPEEVKEIIREYFSVCPWLYEHSLYERVNTLKKFAKFLGEKIDYSISCVPDRREYIKLVNVNCDDTEHISSIEEGLKKFLNDTEDCPLTGCCYDEVIRDGLKKYGCSLDGLRSSFHDYISSIHDEYESMLKDDYLNELCEANEYEFTADGKIY